jgi:hypothetical protein
MLMNGQQQSTQQQQPQQQQQSQVKLEPGNVYLNGNSSNSSQPNGVSSLNSSVTNLQNTATVSSSSQLTQQQQQSQSSVVVDLNNNQIQHSPQLQAAQYYTTLLNASTNATGTQAATNNLIASLNAANYANFLQLQQQQPQQQQPNSAATQLDLLNNLAGLNTLITTNGLSLNHALAGAPPPPPTMPPQVHLGTGHQSEELHMYDYMQKLLEEKEKLKELFNDPFNISLPISARLLDEGKNFQFLI